MRTQVDGLSRSENRPANHAVISATGALRGAKVPVWVRARSYTEEILTFWARVMRDEDEQTALRIRASENLIERAWGKAPVVIVGDEDRPIRVDVSTMTQERLASLESALMLALGESITREALPSLISPPSQPPEGLASGGIGSYQSEAESVCAASTKGQPNVNESLTSVSSAFVLDDAAMQHGDLPDPGEGAALRGGEGGRGE